MSWGRIVKRPTSRVDVFGGGFAGLASAYFALHDARVGKLRVIDRKPRPDSPGGASFSSAGLLHPFSPSGKKIWMGDEGLALSLSLIRESERISNRVIIQRGVHIHRLSERGGEEVVEGGVVVDPIQYLGGLWELLEHDSELKGKSIEWVCSNDIRHDGLMSDDDDDHHGDYHDHPQVIRIVALGAGALDEKVWPDSAVLARLSPELGRNVLLHNVHGLAHARIRGEYAVPNFGGDKVILGATHERNYVMEDTQHAPIDGLGLNRDGVLRDMVGKIHAKGLLTTDRDLDRDLDCVTTGVRVQTRRTHLGRLPLVSRHPTQRGTWLVTGFGSRGLIHHAVVSRAVVAAALAGDASLVPEAILFAPQS